MDHALPVAKRAKLEESNSSQEHKFENSPNGMSNLVLKIKKLSEHATLPVRASSRAAGYDLFAAHDTTIPAQGKELIKTDISLAIPPGHYGRIAPRSSLAWKNHIDVGAGVIDEDYRGPLGVVLFNHSAAPFEVKQGDRVAQLIIEVISNPEVVEVTELDDTDRGQGGFGSTGVNQIRSSTAPHADTVSTQ